MPVEPTSRPDEELLRDLEAFGRTLQASTDGDITSQGIHEVEILPGFGESAETANGVETMRTGSGHRRRWIAAAAAALAIALSIGALVRTATGEEGSTADPIGDGSITTTSEEDGGLVEAEQVENAEDAFVSVGPPLIVAADGSTPLGGLTVDDDTGDVAMVHVNDGGGFAVAYTQMVVGELLDDTELLTTLGWRPDLVDAQTGEVLTAPQWLARSGLTIRTHYDHSLSTLAAQAIVDNLDPESGFDATVITVDPATGGVAVFETTSDTMYWTSTRSDSNPGGTTRPADPLDDDAFECCRVEPGSAFKPIVLAAAFENGASTSDLIRGDGPCVFETDAGTTYRIGGTDQAELSLAAATRASNNCAYVRLGLSVGADATLAVAERLGLTELPTNVDAPLAGLPLGTLPVDPVELTAAYATFANDGRMVQPWFISTITGPDGTILLIRPEGAPTDEQVLTVDTARSITEVLTSVVESGTGRRARIEGRQIAGKTGTMNDFTSAWFVGYTPTWATTVWMGDHDNWLGIERPRPLNLPGWGTVFGGELPAMIWHDYMEPAHAGIEPASFATAEPIDREPRLIAVAEDRTGQP